MNYSPLRYPGGKSKITPLIKLIISKTNIEDVTYIEPFAGGAGVALSLLIEGSVNRIIINDYDKAIYSFWRALKETPDKLISLIEQTPISIDEWRHQKEIYQNECRKYSLELGFSAFYLNRTNRSGILSAGPIGGYDQSGKYKVSARFNKQSLIQKIQEIASRKNQIIIYNKEIRSFITDVIPRYQQNSFIYFDPPYYKNGQRLYKSFFSPNDHAVIASQIKTNVNCDWVITYDNVPELTSIYSEYIQRKYNLNYSVANKGKGSEIIIFKSGNLLPTEEEIKLHANDLQLSKV